MSTQLATQVAGVSLPNELKLVTELQERCNKLLTHFEGVKNSKDDAMLQKAINIYDTTLKKFKDERMPLTRKFDEIKSQFTAIEKQVSDAIDHCKSERNKIATEELKKREAERIKLDLERRKAEIILKAKSDCRIAIRNFMLTEADNLKKGIMKGLASVTEANFEKKLEGLKALPSKITPEKYYSFTFPGLDKKFVDEALDELKDELWDSYEKSIETVKQEAILDMANFSTMTKENRKSFIKEAVSEIDNETAQAKELSEVQESMRKDVESQEVAFSAIGDNVDDLKNVKKGYVIEVENKAAYKSCVAYWFETFFPDFEGQILTKNVGSMITDLERHANQTGIFMKVPGVSYENKVTVINRK